MASLLDQWGRPIEAARKPDTGRLVVPGVANQWGNLAAGLTPARLAAILSEAADGDMSRQCQLATDCEERDGHLASVLQTRRLAVQGLDWEILPADETPEAEAARDLVETALARLDLDDVIADLTDAVLRGFAVEEILWEISGSQALPAAVDWVDPGQFRWQGRTLLLVDALGAQADPLPANKFLVHVAKARSGWPSRAGLIRTVAWLYMFKSWTLKDWISFSETFGTPLRLGKYDPSATAADKQALLDALVSIAANAAGIIPTNADITFPTVARDGASGEVFEKIVTFCERGQSKAVLGQTLSTDAQVGSGTLAGGAHAQVRQDLLEADARAIEKTLKRDLFMPIVGFNLGWDVAARACPSMRFDVREAEDDEKRARTYGILAKEVGVRIGAKHVRRRFGIPEPAEDDELVSGPQGNQAASAAPAPAAQAHKRGCPECSAHAGRAGEAPAGSPQDQVDALAGAAVTAAAEPVDTVARRLVEIVQTAADYEDLQARIVAAWSTLDSTDLEDLMARALHMARLGGRSVDA